MKDNIKYGDKQLTEVISIERKCDGIKEDNFDGNTEGFPVGASDYGLLGLLDSKMIGVTDYSIVRELLGCKEGTSLGIYVWYIEDIPEGILLGPIEVSLKYRSLGLFE